MNLLVRKAKMHDKAAFQQLMEQESKSMYKVAKAILKVDEDVADAMQETALVCWEKIDTLKKDKYFKTWLIRILINNCNTIYRQRKRMLSQEDVPEVEFSEAGYANAEWEIFLNCLEEKYRTIIMLYYVQGFKCREIAHILQMNENTVRGRLAAATLVLAMLSVSAAAYMQWSKGLEEGLQITSKQRQELEENHMASFIGQSVTQNGVTMTVQQSIVDNYSAYLSFKVEGYKVKDGVQPDFSETNIVVGDGSTFSSEWSASFYDGLIAGADGKAIHTDGTPLADDEKISYTMEDGSLEYQVRMNTEEKGYYVGKSIRVELKDLGICSEKAGNVIVEKQGDWVFEWTMTGNNTVEKYKLNTSLGDSGATVLKAELSPISASITYKYPKQEEKEKVIDENGNEVIGTTYKEPPYFVGVRMKNGTLYTNLSDGGFCGYTENNSDLYVNTVSLSQVIDVDQVESLLFLKSNPKEEQPLTEKNLYIVPVK